MDTANKEWFALQIGFKATATSSAKAVARRYGLLTPTYISPQKLCTNAQGDIVYAEGRRPLYDYLKTTKEIKENLTVKYSTKLEALNSLPDDPKRLVNKVKGLLNVGSKSLLVAYHARCEDIDETCSIRFGMNPHLHVLVDQQPTGPEYLELIRAVSNMSGTIFPYRVTDLDRYLAQVAHENFYFMGATTQELLDAFCTSTPEIVHGDVLESDEMPLPDMNAGSFDFLQLFGPIVTYDSDDVDDVAEGVDEGKKKQATTSKGKKRDTRSTQQAASTSAKRPKTD